MIKVKFEIEQDYINQTEKKEFTKVYQSDTISKDDLMKDFEYFLLEFINVRKTYD